ncbi:MAG: TIGR03118 family protein, partial [Blastocatellia bacterium]
WWVANNNSGTSTLYNGQGTPFPVGNPLVVNVPPPPNSSSASTPTGIVFNGSTDFALAPGMPAVFIFVTEDGTISGWNPGIDPHNAVLKVNNSPQAVYKGATIADVNGKHFLYVTNFRTAEIEVYDTNFQRVRVFPFAFRDFFVPFGFAPFNIQEIGKNLYVTYAKQDAAKHDPVGGAGLGFVAVFSTSGEVIQRLQHGTFFNAPWGVALAPGDFGEFSHEILVGNFRGGQIAAFNPATGNFLGLVENPDSSVLTIDGLWALSFGNSGNAGPYNTLFFTAGIQNEAHGLFGTLTAVAAEQDGDEQ